MYSNTTVKEVLDRKGTAVWSIEPSSSILDALHFMAEKNIGAVMVMDAGRLVGVFSERDYARKVVIQGRSETDTTVGDVMTHKVIGVALHQPLVECLALMTGRFIRHLPVVGESGEILGVVSIGDVVKELIAEQDFVITQLVHYVSGDRLRPQVPEKSSLNR